MCIRSGKVAERSACTSEPDKAHLGLLVVKAVFSPSPTKLYGNVVTSQSDPLRRCIVPLRGSSSGVALLAIGASSALNTRAMSLRAAHSTHGGHHAALVETLQRAETE